jgi:hypothetical protein
MDLDVNAILGAMRSHCMASGMFNKVDGHEPKTTPVPDTGLAAAVWLGAISPTSRYSGLAVTSAMVTVVTRLFTPASREPADTVDPYIGGAVATLMTRLMLDLTLGDTCTSIDVFGFAGNPTNAEPMYVQYDDSAVVLRSFTIITRALVADCWEQAP